MEGKNSKKKDIISQIPKIIFIDKQIPNSMKTKKYQFSSDIIIKKRSNSMTINRTKKEGQRYAGLLFGDEVSSR